jgi:signal transduction histidine kinase
LIQPDAGSRSITVTAAQRDRLARMVHDDIMQGLAACVMATDLSARFCRNGRNDDALEELGVIRTGLDLAVTKLRELLDELRIEN